MATAYFMPIGLLRQDTSIPGVERAFRQSTRRIARVRSGSIAADIVRIGDGKLAVHWGVPQDEATRASVHFCSGLKSHLVEGLMDEPKVDERQGTSF